jgi:hypothetical protein
MISMSASKEPHHFCRNERYFQGPDAHNRLFERRPEVKYFGESSTGYMPWPEAPERISRELSNPKAIFLLRHPVDRCFSHYRWRYRLGLEKRSFIDAIKADGFGYHPDRPTEFGYMAYLQFSQYSFQCPLWESALGAENCLYVASSDLKDNLTGTLNRCFSFLDIPVVKHELDLEQMNKTDELVRRPSGLMTALAKALPKSLKSHGTYNVFKNSILGITTPTPPACMSSEEEAYLKEALASDIDWYESEFKIDGKSKMA